MEGIRIRKGVKPNNKYVGMYGKEWWVIYNYGMIQNRRAGPFATREEAEAKLQELDRWEPSSP